MWTAALGINHPWFVRNRSEIFRKWPPIVTHSYANEGRQQPKLNNEAHPKGYLYGSFCCSVGCNSHTFIYLFTKIIVIFMRLLVLAALARNCDFNLMLRLKKQLSFRFQVHGSVHQRWQQWIKNNQMHNSLKIIKIWLYSYSALHVSGTLAPIIRSLIIQHIQPPVTVCRWVGCFFQLPVVTDQSCKIQPTKRHTVTGGCMCRVRGLLMMGARVPETCRAE
jgi:hypothetical protein